MMRTICWTTLLTMTLVLTGGCEKVKVSDEDVPIVKDTQVADTMGQKGVLVVDVRKADDFNAGHLPGAVNVYLPDITKNHPKLSDAKQLIVYAGGWTDPLSLAAAKRLKAMGYANVSEFKGGTSAWTEAGHKLVTSATASEVRPDSK
ncbi:MAG: hypothetical protein GC159_16020 [Phycisphaera sp.]|nr:hypothetical protein [Phycisphaera sp.]